MEQQFIGISDCRNKFFALFVANSRVKILMIRIIQIRGVKSRCRWQLAWASKPNPAGHPFVVGTGAAESWTAGSNSLLKEKKHITPSSTGYLLTGMLCARQWTWATAIMVSSLARFRSAHSNVLPQFTSSTATNTLSPTAGLPCICASPAPRSIPRLPAVVSAEADELEYV